MKTYQSACYQANGKSFAICRRQLSHRCSFFALIIACLGIASLFMANNSTQAQNNKLMPADLLIINATVHTMDPAQPTAEAVAVLGNRIAAVGSTEEIRSLAGSK